MADENKELQVWELLREVEKEMSKEEKKQVMIENAILALAMKYGRNRTKQKTKEKGAKEK